MAFKLAEAFVEFGQRGISPLSGVLHSLHDRIMRLLNPINLVTAALGTMGAALTAREIGRAFSQQEMAEKRLEAVVRATGQSVGWTAGQLKQMASELQSVTTFGDEVTLEAQAMLLTFKSIRGDMFRDVLEAAMDLSSVFQTDLRSSVLQLGKAFEDPARRMRELVRSGINFSIQQETLIKQLQEAGDLVGAQAIMLQAIHSQVGGTARDMANTVTGAFRQMRNAVGDVMEEIGKAFAEVFDLRGLAGQMKEFAETFWERYGDRIRTVLQLIKALANRVRQMLRPVWKKLSENWEDYIATLIEGFRQMTRAVADFATELWSHLAPILRTIIQFVRILAYMLDENLAKGFAKLTLILVGTAGTVWAIGKVIAIVRTLITVIWAATVAVIQFQAMSGRKGWLAIAGGAVVAAAAVGGLYLAYQKLNEEIEEALRKQGKPLYVSPPSGEETEETEARPTAFSEWLQQHAARLAAEYMAMTPEQQAEMRGMTREELLSRAGLTPEVSQPQTMGLATTTLAGLADVMQQEAGRRIQEEQLGAQQRAAEVLDQILQVLRESSETMTVAESAAPSWRDMAIGG